MLGKKNTTGSKVFDWYVTILRKRGAAPAFHPDASQEILDLGDSVFGLVRSSVDRNQSIACLYNFLPESSVVKRVPQIRELFPDHQARDLITGGGIDWKSEFILRPFQALWLVVP